MKPKNINKKPDANIKKKEITDRDKKLNFVAKTIFTEHYMDMLGRCIVNKNISDKESDEIADEIFYMLTGEDKIACIIATMKMLIELLTNGAKMYKVDKNYVLDGPIRISVEE